MSREFEYAATHRDELAMLRDVMESEDVTAYVADWYPSPTPCSFRRISDDVEVLLRRRRMLFLWSPKYSRHQVVLEAVEKDGSAAEPDVYTIERSIGPLIVWSLSSGTAPEDGVETVAFGSVYHQRNYYDPDTDIFPKIPKELVEVYARIVKTAKRHLKKTKYSGGTAYVGHDALARLGAGTLRIRGFGFAE
jgi:hypothetical protein